MDNEQSNIDKEATFVEGDIGGKTIRFETGQLARQASASVLLTMAEVQVLGVLTVNLQKSDRNFLPLSVDYLERFYAAGRIPGSYARREGKPTDHEVLVSRMIDRPIRPMFPKGFRNELQLIAMVMSMDKINPSDVLSMNAAFAAVHMSSVPVKSALGAVRVAVCDGEIVLNPTYEQLAVSKLDLLVAGTREAVTMIEGSAKEVSEELMLEAIAAAHEGIKSIAALLDTLREKAGVAKREFPLNTYNEEYRKTLESTYGSELRPLLEIHDKVEREQSFKAFVEKVKEEQAEKYEDVLGETGDILVELQSDILRKMILEEGKRSDGREMNVLRPIRCSSGILKRAHGSALFTRGETQALCVAALGSSKDQQRVDLATGTVQKPFLLHYNFPPFSVGEVGRMGFVGRREIGHGMLAERSLAAVLPEDDAFDYTIRLVSEILESNGSSSMATVCGGSMALMSAGIPIREHVAGISMGLVIDEKSGKYKVLTDIQGLEDHLGDMDFKVAGTAKGITGFQLDIKVEGITAEIMQEALAAGREARMAILEKMNAAIGAPAGISPHAPKFGRIEIKPDKIRLLVGTGGKTIRRIIEQTKSEIDVDEDGNVKIFAIDDASMEQTKLLIETCVGTPKIGTVYAGKIRRIMPFGVFVQITPGLDGLCHISNLSTTRIEKINDLYEEGQELTVRVESIDESGRISLTAKNIEENAKAMTVNF